MRRQRLVKQVSVGYILLERVQFDGHCLQEIVQSDGGRHINACTSFETTASKANIEDVGGHSGILQPLEQKRRFWSKRSGKLLEREN